MVSELRSYLARITHWGQQSVNRRILIAAAVVGGFTLLAKLASLLKDLIVAHQFGTTPPLAAFSMAFTLISFAINLVAGSFNAALIPTYIQVREHEGRAAAQRLFSNIVLWSTALLLVVSVFLALIVPYIFPFLASGFKPEELALTHSLFLLLLPTLVITGLATTWAAVLNAGERFALAALTPIITPVVTMIALWGFVKDWEIYALAVGTLGGLAVEATLLAWGLKRQGVSLIPRWYGMNPATRQVIHQYTPMVAGALLLGSTTLVNQSMAAILGPQSVNIIGYGSKLVTFLLSIGTMALSTALLPHFSQMVAARNWTGIQHTLKTYSRLVLAVTILLILVLMYFSEPVIRLLFERGAFLPEDTRLASQFQMLYLLQIPFYTLGMLFVRLISSLKANRVLMWGNAISFSLNIFLNFVFMQWLGVAGIALSTSMVYIVSFCYLLFMSLRLLRGAASQ